MGPLGSCPGLLRSLGRRPRCLYQWLWHRTSGPGRTKCGGATDVTLSPPPPPRHVLPGPSYDPSCSVLSPAPHPPRTESVAGGQGNGRSKQRTRRLAVSASLASITRTPVSLIPVFGSVPRKIPSPSPCRRARAAPWAATRPAARTRPTRGWGEATPNTTVASGLPRGHITHNWGFRVVPFPARTPWRICWDPRCPPPVEHLEALLGRPTPMPLRWAWSPGGKFASRQFNVLPGTCRTTLKRKRWGRNDPNCGVHPCRGAGSAAGSRPL